jgi:CDP-diacylglycerol--serine O-phosphatidyltransferase
MGELDNWANNGSDLAKSLAAYLIPAVRSVLPIVTLAVAVLMVSRIRYAHFFNQFLRGPKSRRLVIQLVFAAAVIFFVHELAAPLIFCWFAFTPPLLAGWRELTGRHLRRRTESN